MTNFLYPKRKLIFIHIHKAAGSSIRTALGRKTDWAGGFLPSHWPDFRRFAVVREPVSRFVSTVNMFRFGREDFDDFFATGHLPDLAPKDALDVLETPEIPFDRRIRDPISTLKHHLLPQTHPFNCLHYAQDVLRFENIEEEFSAFCARQHLDISLEKLGASRKPANALRVEDLTAADLKRIRKCYLGDFVQLGYPDPLGLDAPIPAEGSEQPDPWPILRYHLKGRAILARDRLPDPDCDLKPFMATRVTADPSATWAGREADLTAHFQRLEHEFHGRPRLAHLLACAIVVLRRDKTDAAARHLFDRIVREFGPELAGHLNLRWLTSVCDTFMDVASDPLDRATGLAGSLLANTVKLSETERRLFHPPQPDIPLYRFSKGGHLFDGVLTFWVAKGDMMTNLLSRASATLENAGPAAPFTGEIIAKVLEERTVWQRMLKLQEASLPDMAPKELVDDLRVRLSKRDR